MDSLAPGIARISAVSLSASSSSIPIKATLGRPLTVRYTSSNPALIVSTKVGRLDLASEIEINWLMFNLYNILYNLSSAERDNMMKE